MGSFHQLYFHIVIVVYKREKVFTLKNEKILFKYLKEIAEKKNSKIESINAAENHVHILLKLHPSIALAEIIKDLKALSSIFIKENNLFPKFKKWQTGYGAFSVSKNRREIVKNYIRKQKSHHKVKTFEAEYVAILEAHGVSANRQDMIGDDSDEE